MTALDIERPEQLLSYLKECGHLGPSEDPRVERLAGGVSNRTVLVTRENGEAWVIKQALAKLRVEVDWYCDPRRIHCEASALRTLPSLLPAGSTTPLLFEDFEHHLLAMAAVPRPFDNWKEMLLAGRLQPVHLRRFADLLSRLHRLSSERLEGLEQEFGDSTYFQTLRLEPYYGYTGERMPLLGGFLKELAAETLEHRYALVHGDYSPKNVLVRGNDLVLLDHEVTHIGDPGFDVGFCLTHFLSKANHMPVKRSEFGWAAHEFWRRYDSGIEGVGWLEGFERRAVRHALGCLLARVAGRSQLEYLSNEERRRQLEGAARLAERPPQRIDDLIEAFLGGL